uniref:IS1 family transposase n=1 Tax=Bergeriella denitrificans TaxID=494 RepID=UPI0014705BAC
MPQITREIDVLKQLFENLSEQDKQQFLLDVSKSKSTLQKIIQPRKISCCPHCQSSQFVKNGKTDGNQRYLCKECGRTFVESTGTILF